MRVAVIGCGYWGSKHVRVLNSIADVDQVVAVDFREERLTELRREFPAIGVAQRLEDVLVFRVADLGEKEIMLADDRGVLFTTPHWNGYSAVLMRIPSLERIDREELRDLVAEAWLTRAQKRVARAWLAEQGIEDGGG